MNTNEFSDALGKIGDSYLQEAACYQKTRRTNHWMRWAAAAACLLLALTAVFSVWTSRPNPTPLYGVSSLIPPEASEVTVTHIVAGQPETYLLTGAQLEALKAWAASLEYELTEGPEENFYGGEIYKFSFNGQDWGFEYILLGEGMGCFLVTGDIWYRVTNPTDPPLPRHSWFKAS